MEYIQNTHYIGKIQAEYTKLTEVIVFTVVKQKQKGCFGQSYIISQYSTAGPDAIVAIFVLFSKWQHSYSWR